MPCLSPAPLTQVQGTTTADDERIRGVSRLNTQRQVALQLAVQAARQDASQDKVSKEVQYRCITGCRTGMHLKR